MEIQLQDLINQIKKVDDSISVIYRELYDQDKHKIRDADFIIENADIITSVTLAPEMDKDHACIKKLAAESDVLVSMGHTDATFDEAMSAAKDGVNHATHLFNAMSALAHRNPGVVGAALASDNVSVEVIADTFHINPGLYSIVSKVKGDKIIVKMPAMAIVSLTVEI